MKNKLLILTALFIFTLAASLRADNRYWVGGTGAWNNPNHWSETSGGLNGATVPNSTDDVIFNGQSFSSSNQTVMITADAECHSMDWSAINFTAIFSCGTAKKITVYGSYTLSPLLKNGFKGQTVFASHELNNSIITAGKTIIGNWIFNGTGSWALQDDVTTEPQVSISILKGSLTTNHKRIDCGSFIGNSDEQRSLDLTDSEIFIEDVWEFSHTNNLIFDAGTSRIIFKNKYDSKHFHEGNLKYHSSSFLTSFCSPSGTACSANFIITLSGVNISCNGICNGTASVVSVTGGSGNYAYDWSPGNPAGDGTTNITGLCAGTYTVKVTDLTSSSFCFCSVQISEPAVLFDYELFTTNPTCNGLCNGMSGVDATGGTFPYTYIWNPGNIANDTAFNLCAGTYTVGVTDFRGCTASTTIIVSQPLPLLPTGSSTNITCHGVCSGTATVAPTGGTPGYTYNWTPGNPTGDGTPAVTGLCALTYSCTITDSHSCVATYTTTIIEPPQLTGSITSQTNVLCNGGNNGSVTVAGANGTPGYTYSINGVTFFPSGTFSGLTAGSYTITVKDANGCTITVPVTIIQPTLLTASITSQTNVLCNGGSTGTVTVAGHNATPPYTFSINGVTFFPSGIFNGLAAGIYTITVKDANGCTTTQTVTITQPPLLTGSIVTQTNVLCASGNTGSVTVAGAAGSPGYTYSIDGVTFQASGTFNGLTAGVYSVTVKDSHGCTIIVTVTITAPPPLTGSIVTQTNVLCTGGNTGSVTVAGAGGTPGYTYSINAVTFQASGTFNNLGVGVYTITVKDANGCTTTVTVTIIQPILLTGTIVSQTNVLCHGGNTGSVSVAGANGTPGYTYSINGIAFFPSGTFSGLIAGNYTITVKDANGCTATVAVTITQPNILTVVVNASALLCSNNCNATAAAVVSGGTPPYVFSWSPGSPVGNGTNSISSLCAGTYTVNITDAHLCTATTSVVIVQPPPLTLSSTSTNVTCFNGCNGTAIATAGGGTPAYSFLWSPGGQTTATVTNLCAGTYIVTLTDANNCTMTNTVIITQPPQLLGNPTALAPITCHGLCNGSATSAPTGGVPPYTYNWSPGNPTGDGTPTITNLCAGVYNLVVTDSNLCTSTQPVTILQPPTLNANITNATPSCNVCNGTATVTATGGTGTYTYLWMPTSQIAQTATGLCPGVTYTVTATDINGCTDTDTVTIVQTISIVITTTNSTLTCFGSCNGTATATAIGGVLPYSYLWTGPGGPFFTQTVNNLCAGTYTVKVTDATGCFNTSNVTFTNPPQLGINATSTNVTCNGLCNGTATVTASGGTGTFTYSWLIVPVQNTQSISNLCAGTYIITVTDGNGCSNNSQATVTQPTTVIDNVVLTASSCIGNTGTIAVTPSGGAGGYSYTWGPGNPTGQGTPTITNLALGPYTLQITDAANCVYNFNYSLNSPSGPTLTMSGTNMTCNGVCNGAAAVVAVGGAGGYLYNWTPGNPTGDGTANITSLCSGIYTVQVTDAGGCNSSGTFNVTNPSLISPTPTVVNETCGGACNGSISLAPTGGTGTYTYSWLPGLQATSSITNLCAGNYSVTVSDVNGCDTTMTFTITSPPTLFVNLTSSNVLCNGACNGTATANVSGGSGTYTYSWTNSPSSNPFINALCPNQYIVTVTDGSLCVAKDTVVITEPTPLSSSATQTNATCFNLCNGTATLTGSGGTPPYTYMWSPGSIANSNATGLCAGVYNGTVTDANGCTSVSTVTITQPVAIIPNATFVSPTCNGICNGSATAAPTGGTAPYTYNWVPGNIPFQSISNVCAGTYTLTVTGFLGCTSTQIITITEPPLLNANATSTPPTCTNLCNGSVISNPIGGTGTYTYSWSPIASVNPSLSNLCPGNYTVIVSDVLNCKDTQIVAVINPLPIDILVGSTPSTCGACDGTLTLSPVTGTSPYNYLWSPNVTGQGTPNGTALCAGIYNVTVSDLNGCDSTFVLAMNNSGGPTGETVTTTDVTCSGACNGAGSIVTIGGVPPYSYLWNNTPIPTASNAAINLCAGNYFVQVTDSNSCIHFSPVTINEPLPLLSNAVVTNATCGGICNGSITTAASGGTPGYTYLWSPGNPTGQGTPAITNLCVGTYTLTITDSHSCITVDTFIVAQAAPLLATINSNSITCSSACTGVAYITISSGTPPYTIQWNDSNGQTNDTATALCAGNYSVSITDASGCNTILNTVITATLPIAANASITNATCGVCNGQATLTPSGGTGTYSYLWSNALNSSSANNLCAGLYTVDITDGAGCTVNVSVPISNTGAPTSATIASTNVSCFGLCDGSVTSVIPVGGTPPFTYHWIQGGQSTPAISNLCAGVYFIQITDANGCSLIDSVTITEPPSFQLNQQVTATTCGACNGSITINPTGCSGASTVLWNTGSSALSLNNLCAGIYSVQVTCSTGCVQTITIPLNSQNSPTLSTTTTDVTCNGSCNGIATVLATGGVAPYSYLWNDFNSQTNDTATALCAGNYLVQVTGNNGCVGITNVTISEASPLGLSLSNVINPLCNNSSNGSITALPSGGTLPYTYSWSPSGGNGATASGLAANVYTVTVTDGNSCSVSQTSTLVSPLALTITNIFTSPSCTSFADGSIDITVGGGSPPYTYQWSGSSLAIIEDLTNLLPGVYYITAKDSHNCTILDTITLNPVIAVIAAAGNDTAFCANGTLTLNAGGSSNAVNYNWFVIPANTSVGTGVSITVVPPVGVTNYYVQVDNGAGCFDRDTIAVTAALAATAIAGNDTLICTSSAITLNGNASTGAALFSWFQIPANTNIGNSSTVSVTPPVGITSYYLQVDNGTGCTDKDTITITVPPAISAHAGNDTALCANGTITLNANGSTNGINYNWFVIPSNTLAGTGISVSITPPAGTTNYYVVVDNGLGCSDNDTMQVAANPLPVAFAGNDTTICNSPTVTLNGNSSTGTVLFNWYMLPANVHIGSTSNVVATPPIGTTFYYLSADNGSGCTDNDTVSITIEPIITAVAGNDTSFCQSGSISLNASQSTGAIAGYQWFQLPSVSLANTITTTVSPPVGATTYYVMITNASGCADYDSLIVTSNPIPVVSAGADITIALGSATTIGGNPTGPSGSSFVWSPIDGLNNSGLANPVANPVVNTLYTVTVTTAEGCSASDDILVTVEPGVSFGNGISPNGDGFNDVWEIDHIEEFPNCVVEVYNRWGEMLFQSTGYHEKFDGTYKGKALPVGTYYYIINLNDPVFTDVKTGPITILR